MKVTELSKRGLDKFFIGASVDPQKVSVHISEVEPGNRLHAAHTHTGVETFYVLEGQVTVEVEGEQFPLEANQAMAVDATKPHGLFNRGTTRAKYMVIIAQ